MNAFSNRLSVNPERPVDPVTRRVLNLIDQLLRGAQIAYMLVGATARDLILHHVFGERVTRATYDLDFAVLVDSWEQFSYVKQLLVSRPDFREDSKQIQRFYYKNENATFETIVDIIPFGHLESTTGMIAWPPNSDVLMNVVAFSDAYKSAATVELDAELSIPVTSLAGLMILKLFAWLDRHENRDVQDIRKLLETYTGAGNVERLYEQEEEQLERDEFDTTLSGAFLLGKDVRRITDEKVRHELGTLLTDDARSNLATQIARTMSILEDRTEHAATLLSHFFDGLGSL